MKKNLYDKSIGKWKGHDFKMENRKMKFIATLCILMILIAVVMSVIVEEKKMMNTVEKQELVVYTPHPIEFVKPLIKEFESSTGIHVDIVKGGSGELLEKIKKDKSADIMWGGSLFSVSPYSDCFANYTSPNEMFYLDTFLNYEGNLTRFTDVPSVIMINTDLIGDLSINGYKDLLQPELKGKIAFASPKDSSSSFEQLINMLYACGNGNPEEGWDYVRELCVNLDGNLLGSSSSVYNGVADGKFIAGLTFEEAAATLLKDGKHVKIIYMEEGVVSTPDGICLVKDAKHVENAKKLIDFLTGHEAQYMITQNLGRRSVRKDIKEPVGLPMKKDINILYADKKEVLENREKWIERFEEEYQEANQ